MKKIPARLEKKSSIRMKKRLRKAAILIGTTVASIILILVLGFLLFYYDKPLTRNVLQKFLADKTGAEVVIGRLDYGFFPAGMRASNTRISLKDQGGQITLFIRQLQARGQLKRLLKNTKPVFGSIEVEGARFEIDKKSPGRIDLEEVTSAVAKALSYTKKLTIKDSSLNLVLPRGYLALRGAELTVSGSQRPDAYEFTLGCEAIELRRDERDLHIETGLTSSGILSLSGRGSMTADVRLSDFRFVTPWLKNALQIPSFDLNGEFKAGEKTVSVSAWKTAVPGLAVASGDMKIRFAQDFSLQARSRVEVEALEHALSYLSLLWPQKPSSLELTGKASVEASYECSTRAGKKKDWLEAAGKVEGASLKYGPPGTSLQTLISGRFRLRGPLADIRIDGEISGRGGTLTSQKLTIRDFGFRLPFEAGKNVAKSDDFRATIGWFVFPSGKAPLSFKDVMLRGAGSLDLPRQALRLDILEARSLSLSPFQSSGRIDFGPGHEKHLKLVGKKMKLSILRTLFSAHLPEKFLGWEVDSDCDFEIEVRNSSRERGFWDFSAGFDLSQGKFQDSTSSIAGEALRVGAVFEGRYDPATKNVRLRGELSFPGGETLWKDFYVNWSGSPVKAGFSGTYGILSGQLSEFSSDISVATFGELHAEGGAGLQKPLSATLKTSARMNLASLFPLLIKGQPAHLAQMNVRGELRADLNVEKKEGSWSVSGILGVKDGGIENRASGLSISKIEAAIPLSLAEGESGESPRTYPTPPRGYFRLGNLETRIFKIDPLELAIQGEKNALWVDPFSIKLLGGVAEFGKTSLSLEPRSLSFKGDSSLRLREIDISQLPLQNKQFHLQGYARAELFRIELQPSSLVAHGEGSIDIFGGRATVRNISVTQPFSQERTFVCDVDLRDIDLEKLTGSVPFGRVTGSLAGEIKNLEISYGQPESFDLRLESVKKRGVSQKFSLKAVNSLSILSSGEKAGVPSSTWWLRFVSSFGYSRIGIRSTLKNDMFTLRGTIVENGVQYLVRRSRFFGIDVINKQPEKGISFRDMIERLKKVGAQAASK